MCRDVPTAESGGPTYWSDNRWGAAAKPTGAPAPQDPRDRRRRVDTEGACMCMAQNCKSRLLHSTVCEVTPELCSFTVLKVCLVGKLLCSDALMHATGPRSTSSPHWHPSSSRTHPSLQRLMVGATLAHAGRPGGRSLMMVTHHLPASQRLSTHTGCTGVC